MAKIRNINGSSNNTCNCGSWLSHWIRFARKRAIFCSEINCVENKLVGAHVQKYDTNDSNWYIVPLCQKHNMSKDVLDVGFTIFVSANKKVTCDN